MVGYIESLKGNFFNKDLKIYITNINSKQLLTGLVRHGWECIIGSDDPNFEGVCRKWLDHPDVMMKLELADDIKLTIITNEDEVIEQTMYNCIPYLYNEGELTLRTDHIA